MNRILETTRLHTIVWKQTMLWPWAIMGISFLVNILIFASIGDTGRSGGNTTGGLASIYSVVAIVGAIAINQVFPFALGMGITRRTFYLATALVMVAQAFAYAIVLYLLKLLEGATDGFGVDLRFFRVPFVDVHNGFLQILVFAVPFLAISFLAIFAATTIVRWGTNGFFAAGAAALLVVGLLAALITWQGWWLAIWHWLSDQSATSLLVGWPALIAGIAAVGGLVVIRRANA
jgi:hypothetical protein